MEAVLAVLVGIAFGSALAAAVAIPLRRRRRNPSDSVRLERTRRVPLERPEQRQRAALIAAGFAVSATLSSAAGAQSWAAIFMLGALVLAVQAATSAILVRVRDRRST